MALNVRENWMDTKWRPAMGWMYMGVCVCDFVVFPILWSMMQALNGGTITSQWQPLTLQGAGLFHIAMGAVLGITAMGRTREKLTTVVQSNPSNHSYFAEDEHVVSRPIVRRPTPRHPE